jgi:predicted MFS family arabinose efflux permease|tara:strand:- start:2362 stop:3552 length:1191 start_codon:yes stop_codon:yes gene_type:complete
MIRAFLQRHPLPAIVIAQLCGTSLWFSVNGVWLSLSRELEFSEAHLGFLTLAVQAGFIVGTLGMAITGLADRFRASHVFAVASLLGAVINGGFVLAAVSPPLDVVMRFMTGLCLAGIYPLGMKLVISWTPKHAGAALSWLVGMLTVGTALPHLLRGATVGMSWQWPMLAASVLALVGGALVLVLGDGPHLPKRHGGMRLREGLAGLMTARFRAVAGGYFGHCWELYTFWMLVPLLIGREVMRLDVSTTLIPWLSFIIIALGAIGCVGGGWISRIIGSQRVARYALVISGFICLIYPFLTWAPAAWLLVLLALWGIIVIADSPQFSALAAINAPQEFIGSSLAMMNALGFALTLPAIWVTSALWSLHGTWVILWLLPGPVLGLCAFRGLGASKANSG